MELAVAVELALHASALHTSQKVSAQQPRSRMSICCRHHFELHHSTFLFKYAYQVMPCKHGKAREPYRQLAVQPGHSILNAMQLRICIPGSRLCLLQLRLNV